MSSKKVFTMKLRMSKEDSDLMREGAGKYGMSNSEWIRYLLRIGTMLMPPAVYKTRKPEDLIIWE